MLLARYNANYTKSQSLFDHASKVAIFASKNLRPLALSKLGELAAYLHDLGKAYTPWQEALTAEKQKYLDNLSHIRKPLDVPHAPNAAQLTYHLLKDLAQTRQQKACLEMLCLSIAAHHGYLMDVVTPEGLDYFKEHIIEKSPKNIEGLEKFYAEIKSEVEIKEMFLEACVELAGFFSKVPQASDHDKNTYKQARKFHIGMVVRSLYSALIDADRLDAASFEHTMPDVDIQDKIEVWTDHLNALESFLLQFPIEKIIDHKRREISLQSAKAGQNQEVLTALHAPTGSGKTLSGLRWALEKAKANKGTRIFYIVSYTTILDQVYEDFKAALKDSHSQADILLHHSNILPEDELFDSMSADKKADAHRLLLAERWDAEIILTTQVQFFNALFLGNGKAARRLRGLYNAVIIFDEVQTIPPRLVSLFNLAINYLTTLCGCKILLSSATQPGFSKLNLPLLPVSNIFEKPDELFSGMRRVQLIDMRSLGQQTAEDLGLFASEQQRTWDSVLIVLNTRRAAKKVYDALRAMELSDVSLHLLSNDLCPAHRKEIINKLRTDSSASICVSTQLIECGVNLSFGCAIRSRAGADNIWQTAGRCNRHDDGGIHPVYIIESSNEDIDKLPEITSAQIALSKVLDELKDCDRLQLPSAMSRYYEFFFTEESRNLNYPARFGDQRTTIVQMLTENSLAIRNFKENSKDPSQNPSQPLIQSFQSAGKVFTVIDSMAQAIITPFGRGKEIILELSAKPDLLNEKRLIREAQFYSVNIFLQQIQRLYGEGAIFQLPCGALAIREEWYDNEKTGLLEAPVYDGKSSIFY